MADRTAGDLAIVLHSHMPYVEGFGTYPFAIFWLIEDLTALHAGEGQDAIGTVDDVAARWAAYEELVR